MILSIQKKKYNSTTEALFFNPRCSHSDYQTNPFHKKKAKTPGNNKPVGNTENLRKGKTLITTDLSTDSFDNKPHKHAINDNTELNFPLFTIDQQGHKKEGVESKKEVRLPPKEKTQNNPTKQGKGMKYY